jgi:hypothetical protein
MIRLLTMLFTLSMLFISCAPHKPAYKTKEGKHKLEHYNKIQFGEKKERHQ